MRCRIGQGVLAKEVHSFQPAALLSALGSQMGAELVRQALCDACSSVTTTSGTIHSISITRAAVGEVLIVLLAVRGNQPRRLQIFAHFQVPHYQVH